MNNTAASCGPPIFDENTIVLNFIKKSRRKYPQDPLIQELNNWIRDIVHK